MESGERRACGSRAPGAHYTFRGTPSHILIDPFQTEKEAARALKSVTSWIWPATVEGLFRGPALHVSREQICRGKGGEVTA